MVAEIHSNSQWYSSKREVGPVLIDHQAMEHIALGVIYV